MKTNAEFRYTRVIGILNVVSGILCLILGFSAWVVTMLGSTEDWYSYSISYGKALFSSTPIVWGLFIIITGILAIMRKLMKLVLIGTVLTLLVMVIIASSWQVFLGIPVTSDVLGYIVAVILLQISTIVLISKPEIVSRIMDFSRTKLLKNKGNSSKMDKHRDV
jgi:hypothetical protein